MAKETKISKEKIISAYTKIILEEGKKKPNSIYHFCQLLKK